MEQVRENNSSPEPTGFQSETYFNSYQTPVQTFAPYSMVNQQLYQPYYYSAYQYPTFYNTYMSSSPSYYSATSLSVSTSSESEDTSVLSTSSPSNSSVGSITTTPSYQLASSYYSNTSPDVSKDTQFNNSDESEETTSGVVDSQQKATQRVKRRSRTCFTEYQLRELESTFERNNYPDVRLIDDLVERLNLSIERISIWFQNRRAREKKNKKKVALAGRNAVQAAMTPDGSSSSYRPSVGYYQTPEFYQQPTDQTTQSYIY